MEEDIGRPVEGDNGMAETSRRVAIEIKHNMMALNEALREVIFQ